MNTSMRATLRWAIAVALCAPVDADAGRSHFGWLYGSEINPNHGVELETWIVDVNKLDKPDGKVDETQLWNGIVFAPSDHVQLAVAVETEFANDHVDPPTTNITKFGADIRWRPQAPGPEPLTTLFRFGVKRLTEDRAGIRTEANIVIAYEQDSWIASVDIGGMNEHLPSEDVVEFRPAAGVSFRVIEGFRVGAETYGELTVVGPDPGWQVVGPTVSLTSGRIWGAATLGVGLLGVRDAGRITIGVAL